MRPIRTLKRVARQTQSRLAEVGAVDQATQLLLVNQYRLLRESGGRLPRLDEVGLHVHSQNGEDGILLYLFALLGTTNKRSVELCAGDGTECNTANLLLNHGWTGMLVDGNAELVQRGRAYFARHPLVWQRPPTFVHAWLERETVPDVVRAAGFAGPLDLLSFDVDGNDYWFMEALLPHVSPRVAVLECVGEWGPEASVTIPYTPTFHRDDRKRPGYSGASLPAFVKLLAPTHRLVGLERHGYNAFFVARGLEEEALPERTPAEVYEPIGWTPAWADGVRRYEWQAV